jgi:hypothetical protein
MSRPRRDELAQQRLGLAGAAGAQVRVGVLEGH